MKVCRWAALGLAAVLLAGCGGGSDQGTAEKRRESKSETAEKPAESPSITPLVVTMSSRKGPETAGVAMADERGYFADVGLEVMALAPEEPTRTIRYVVEGYDQIGVAPEPQIVLAKEKGVPIVAIGSLVPRPVEAMIWLEKSQIDGIADLKGKTIAIPGFEFQKGFLKSVLVRAGLTLSDVRVKSVGHNLVPSLVGGRADAIFGGYEAVEGVELESRGLDPVVTPVDSLGLPEYEEMMWITRTDYAAQHPRELRSFLAAVRRGTAAATASPQAAAKAVDEDGESTPFLNLEETEAAVEATLPLLSKTGYMSPGRARDLMDWMRNQEMIQRAPPVSSLLTNRFLPQS